MTSSRRVAGSTQESSALVLGAGGVVGMASSVGVLRALADVSGWDARRADLIVGTSAGAVLATQLRLGVAPDALSEVAATLGQPGEARNALVRAWRTPADLARRAVGAGWVAARSRVPFPMPPAPRWLGRAFPGAVFHVGDIDRLEKVVPDQWPDGPLWLVANDLDRGVRVPIGRDAHHREVVSMRQAVLASCAVPGLYRPARIGSRTFVDGGTFSSTNLDLVVGHAKHIVAVAPVTAAPGLASPLRWQLLRAAYSTSLAVEAWYARRNGARVVLFQPRRRELRYHSMNLLRDDRSREVEAAAHAATVQLLREPRIAAAMDDLMQASTGPVASA